MLGSVLDSWAGGPDWVAEKLSGAGLLDRWYGLGCWETVLG